MPKTDRTTRLLPGGEPRWVRCYDSAGWGHSDRYSVVFTGKRGGILLTMDERPQHPQGICMSSEFPGYRAPDLTPGSWAGPSVGRRCALGTRIRFSDLPEACRGHVLAVYRDLWKV